MTPATFQRAGEKVMYDDLATTGDSSMTSIYRRGGVWWCSFTGHDGKRRRESCHTRDRRAAMQTATRREHLHWLVAEGIMPVEQLRARDRGRKALSDLAPVEKDGNASAFIDYARLSIALEFGADQLVADLERWLREQREVGLAIETVNKKLWSVQRFGDWLWRNGYIPANASLRVKPVAKRGEVRKMPHRALTPAEAEGLFAGDFGLYYRFRCFTGLRGSEAALIERRDLDLGDYPTLTVRAEVAKNGHACTMPLARSLAERLPKMAIGPIFPDVPRDRAKRTRMLRPHLDSAGLDREVNGRSLRMAFVTWLEAAGVELGVRMKLRRDRGGDSVRLTNVTYSDPKQVGAILRAGLSRMEDWYASQLTGAGRAVSC